VRGHCRVYVCYGGRGEADVSSTASLILPVHLMTVTMHDVILRPCDAMWCDVF
jgi:hypothetical protein